MTDEHARRYSVAAVEKALRVLDCFAVAPHRFILSDIAARSGLSVNQSFRLLQTLVDAGYVRQDPETRRYALGPRAFGIVRALFHGDELVIAGRDALDRAHGETGETVALIAPDGEEGTVCIAVRQSAHPLLVAAEIGSRSTFLHAGAVGKIFLAAREPAAVERYLQRQGPLPRFTDRTPASAAAVRAEVERARAQGFAVSDEEIADGMYGIAAPVRDRQGVVVAAVTLSAPVGRAGAAERTVHRRAMMDASRRISTNLGFRVASLGIEADPCGDAHAPADPERLDQVQSKGA